MGPESFGRSSSRDYRPRSLVIDRLTLGDWSLSQAKGATQSKRAATRMEAFTACHVPRARALRSGAGQYWSTKGDTDPAWSRRVAYLATIQSERAIFTRPPMTPHGAGSQWFEKETVHGESQALTPGLP